jgi:hypothetical protein
MYVSCPGRRGMIAGVAALEYELQALRDRAERVKQRFVDVTRKLVV